MTETKTQACIVQANAASLHEAAGRIMAGKLVAFPTETVYGLGANALNSEALLGIFAAKARPLSDPLIVHVSGVDEAFSVVDVDGHAREMFEMLAESFWPGPLTLIGKARGNLPAELSAGTGYVGVRCPDSAIARDLIAASKVPIAAPSANKFGHVSPTSAAHVLADLRREDVLILDGGRCRVGIESTVVKVDEKRDGHRLVVYRKGGVSEKMIHAALEKNGWADTTEVTHAAKVERNHQDKLGSNQGDIAIDQKTEVKQGNGVCGEKDSPSVSPGQLLTHYAPNLNSWLLSPQAVKELKNLLKGEGEAVDTVEGKKAEKALSLSDKEGVEKDLLKMRETVVIDFAGALKEVSHAFLAYRDLSEEGDVAKVAEGLYQALRWSELVENAENVLLVEVLEASAKAADEHVPAVRDKMYRASSGKVAARCG